MKSEKEIKKAVLNIYKKSNWSETDQVKMYILLWVLGDDQE